MTTDVATVPPDAGLDDTLDLLADDDREGGRLPVTDEDGRLVGVVVRQDLFRALRDERRESKR
jgi:CBS domain-containing protein